MIVRSFTLSLIAVVMTACSTAMPSAGKDAPREQVSSVEGSADKESRYHGLEWRFVGPMRGGRTNAVVGHPTDKMTFYAGYTGGGVWQTRDGGVTWENLSDRDFNVGSIGAIAISESHPETLYVGTGEHALRGDISHGDGVYKSTDGGESWRNIGLHDTRQIAEILVHPKNPDIVFVAALGPFTGSTQQRGIFKSEDGGKSWERVLFVSPDAGAIEIEMSRDNPDLLFAATWDVRRFPWGIRSAGTDSRIFRSRDGGDTWEDISDRPGFPAGMREKIGLGLTDAKPGRIWALVSGESGRGVYLSDDYGDSWTQTARDKKLLARTYYFNHMTADPQDPDTVYVLNDRLWRSTDAGQTFEDLPHNHADHHDMWIDPNDNSRIIDATDGGAEVSFNRGETWSTLFNQPTGQSYTLTLDNDVPYNLYGAQQDWSTIAVPSRHKYVRDRSGGYFDTAYSEAGRVAIDQKDPDILYISDHHWLLKYSKRDGGVQYVGPRDETNYGWGTADIKYRFNWTFPVLASVHYDRTLYTASQYLHMSKDGGQTWLEISPDLTRADPDKLEKTPLPGAEDASNPEYWGPLTRDSNGDHWFSTLYTVAESPLVAGLLWTGSDDGFVQLTRDNGVSWTNVTPPEMPKYAMVTQIHASPHDPGTAYVTASEYKLNNYQTHVFRTTNYGANWQSIISGLPADEVMRSIVADPAKQGLLYAGGETGVYISHTDGNTWESIRLNMPAVPTYDMKIRGDDLVLATHGRGFWIMDDLSVFRQDAPDLELQTKLFSPATAMRWSGRWAATGNAPDGLVIHYRLSEAAKHVSIGIRDAAGTIVRTFDSDSDAAVSTTKGLRSFNWDLRYPSAQRIDKVVTRGNQEVGPRAVPGTYKVDLTIDGETLTAPFDIAADPRIGDQGDGLQRQFEFLIAIRDRLDAMNKGVISIRAITRQAQEVLDQNELNAEIRTKLAGLISSLKRIEQDFVQVNAEARKDLHANPVALNDKFYRLSNFASRVEAAPTPTQVQMFEEFSQPVLGRLAELGILIDGELAEINQALIALDVEAIEAPGEYERISQQISATMPN